MSDINTEYAEAYFDECQVLKLFLHPSEALAAGLKEGDIVSFTSYRAVVHIVRELTIP